MESDLIIQSLITREDYCRAVSPFIKEEHFEESHHKLIYQTVTDYFGKYHTIPSSDALQIECEKLECTETDISEITDIIEYSRNNSVTDPIDYLFESTEKYVQDRELYIALTEAINIVENDESKDIKALNKHAIPDLLRKALGVSFDEVIGHNYTEEWLDRYEFYNEKESRLPFDLSFLNDITTNGNGVKGLPNKTLTLFAGASGSGKSLALCHLATTYLKQGKNVLYITLEMSEFMISQRIDTNLMDIKSDELYAMDKESYKKKVDKIRQKTTGKLIVKEYPTGAAHAGHFRHLISELKIKKKFDCDVIIVDYLGICASSRVKNNQANSYTIQKSIAEELRALAIENDCPVVSAGQLNRCLGLDTKISEKNKGDISISDVCVGDFIKSDNGYNRVNNVYPIEVKKSYKITLESGQTIVCSGDHIFPTNNRSSKSINSGLASGDFLQVL